MSNPAPPSRSAWLTELPYGIVIVSTMLGVAYASYAKQPMTRYWLRLAPLIGGVCIASGWRHTHDRAQRVRLIST